VKIINPLKVEFHQIIHINSVRTSQETLHKQIVVAFCENRTEPVNALWEQNAEF
jgi:hypothetical protein